MTEATKAADPREAAIAAPLLAWNIPANLRWLAEQPDRPGWMPCGALTGGFLRDAAGRIESLVEQAGLAEEDRVTAEEERDALLAALGWKTGSFSDPLTRKVVLDDSGGLRSEMVKARQAAQEAQGDRDVWRMILGEFVHDSRSGVLGRLWEELKTERRRRKEAEALIHHSRIPYAAALRSEPGKDE